MTHCANNDGPYQLPEKLIPLMITNVLRGRKVPVYGDGLQRRDWLHVLDHCAAIHTILHADLEPAPPEAATNPALLPIFDISARREVTNLEIIDRVLAVLGRDPAGHPPSSSSPGSKKLSAGTSTTKPGGRQFSRAKGNWRSSGHSAYQRKPRARCVYRALGLGGTREVRHASALVLRRSGILRSRLRRWE